MFKRRIFILFVTTSLLSIAAYAQDPASDLQDLVGGRASGGESQLRSRGYVFVKTTKGNDRTWSNWWNARRNQCVTIVTRDGRYDSIVTSPGFDCNRNTTFHNDQQTAPSWARGTWYWTGGDRVVTISNNGGVTVWTGGGVYHGYYNGGRMYLNNDYSTVARSGNQLRTYNQNTGETSYYSRTPTWGGSGPVFGGGSGNRPQTTPSWARGTWYWTGGDRVMTISSNGTVIVTTGGQSYSGYYNGGRIYLNNDVSTLTRSGSQIRTNNQSNGETSYYSRSRPVYSGPGFGGGNNVNVSDLVGVRASSGETQMRNRGFRNVDTFRSGNAVYTIWWRSRSRQCIQVATADGKYDSVTDIQTHPKCN